MTVTFNATALTLPTGNPAAVTTSTEIGVRVTGLGRGSFESAAADRFGEPTMTSVVTTMRLNRARRMAAHRMDRRALACESAPMGKPDYSKYRYLTVSPSPSGVTTVTMNRPDSGNAVNSDMHEEIQDIWIDVARDYDTKVVVLTGAGKSFCVGGDVKDMAGLDIAFGAGHDISPIAVTSAEARRAIFYMLDVEQPIISAINGNAVGLGATLALCADMSVMSATARIGDPHVKVGLVAGDGGAVLWPLLVGPSRAKEFLLRGSLINGVEAERIGLVNHVRPAEDVLSAALEIADEIAALPPLAVRWTKLSVNRWLKDVYHQVFDVSIALEQLTLQSADHKEAAQAFVERRTPRFTGR